MAAPSDALKVRTGASGLLAGAPLAIAWLAGLGLLAAPAPFSWRLLSLAALALCYRLVCRGWRHTTNPGRLRLFPDGLGTLDRSGTERHIQLGGTAWLSPWICVIPLKTAPGAAIMPCMVCAAENRPDDYRRLRVLLRLRGDVPSPPGEPL